MIVPLGRAGVNAQAPEKTIGEDGDVLEVQEIFHTLQGEGPYAGTAAVFVRLAGCNLQCPGCDTDYTSRRKSYQAAAIAATVNLIAKGTETRLVVVTGGEPFRQRCGELTRLLLRDGYRVQFETNGTIYDPSMRPYFGNPRVTVVCSPKAGVNFHVLPEVSAFKYVLKAGETDPLDGLPLKALDSHARPERPPLAFSGPVYLQPYDEGDRERNTANLRECVKSCLRFDYTLCVQLHKLEGVCLP